MSDNRPTMRDIGSSPCPEWTQIQGTYNVDCERGLHHKGNHKAFINDTRTRPGSQIKISWRQTKRPKGVKVAYL